MDEDIWLEEFQKKAGQRLRAIFEKDLNGLPKGIVDKIEALRQQERQLMARKPK